MERCSFLQPSQKMWTLRANQQKKRKENRHSKVNLCWAAHLNREVLFWMLLFQLKPAEARGQLIGIKQQISTSTRASQQPLQTSVPNPGSLHDYCCCVFYCFNHNWQGIGPNTEYISLLKVQFFTNLTISNLYLFCSFLVQSPVWQLCTINALKNLHKTVKCSGLAGTDAFWTFLPRN